MKKNYLNVSNIKSLLFNTKPFTLLLFLLLTLTFCLKLYLASTNSLYFDEAAAWDVAKSTSYTDLFLGHYSDVGDMPLFYIVSKSLLFANIELLVRLIPYFTSILFYYFFYRLVKHDHDRNIALLTTFILGIVPIFFYYSIEFRSYLFSALFQILLILYYVKTIKNFRHDQAAFVFIFALLSLFSGFSSFFIIFALLLYTLFTTVLIKKHKIILVFYFVLSTCLALLWLYFYNISEYGELARNSYVNTNTKLNLNEIYQLLKDIFAFTPTWDRLPTIASLWPTVSEISNFISIFIFIYVYIKSLKNFFLSQKDETKIFNILFFIATISISLTIIMALLMFSTLSVRFNLLFVICITYFYVLHLSESYKTKKYCHFFVLIFGIFAIVNSTTYLATTKRLPFNTVSKIIVDHIDESSCFVISHEITRHILSFYIPHQMKNLDQKRIIYVQPKTKNYDSSLEKKISYLSEINCGNIHLIYYHNSWDKESKSYKKLEKIMVNMDTLYSNQFSNELSLEIYSSKYKAINN